MSKVLRIAICEDLKTDAERLCLLICESKIETEISWFASGEDFLSFSGKTKYHLVFMDIYMDGLNGMEAARILREKDEGCPLVFTTTSSEHALEAFGVNAVQYLIKPVCFTDIQKILQKRQADLEKEVYDVMRVNARGEWMEVLVDNILYIEVRNHNCLIHTTNGIVETGTTMRLGDFSRLAALPNFLRCHRAFIVNLSYIARLGQDFIMENGDTVYIRQADFKKCAETFKNYLLDQLDKEG